MSHGDYDKLFDHEYDGIKEYDNPLPSWWTWLWVASMVFSVVYFFYYHVGVGPSVEDKYQTAVASHIEKQLASLGEISADDQTIVRLMNEDEFMSAMGGLFRGSCAQCHANDGGGNVGPNLTDDQYKNVTRPRDIFRIINEGIPGTSMPAWGTRFREPQMILLAAYVASLRGQEAASPKAPEGNTIPPWPAVEESDGEDEAPAPTASTVTPGDSGA